MTNHQDFRLDRRNARWLGVCAGIAGRTGIDVTLVRAGVIVASLCTFVTLGVVVYVIAAIAASNRD